MIAVAIIAVLAGVAYPSFMDQVRKGRRSEAIEFASRIQQLQARHRANNPTYAANLAALGIASGTSATGLYTLSTATAVATNTTAYTVTATAVAGKSQAADGNCSTMTLTFSAGSTSYGSNAQCWGR